MPGLQLLLFLSYSGKTNRGGGSKYTQATLELTNPLYLVVGKINGYFEEISGKEFYVSSYC